MQRRLLPLVGGVILTIFISPFACDRQEEPEGGAPPGETVAGNGIGKAVAVLYPASDDSVRGMVTFTQTGDSIRVVADLTGLSPGRHGIHIHEYGDCSAPDASSAGGHFNPDGSPHGSPTDAEHHAGDFGNIEAGPDGRAHLDVTLGFLEFEGPSSILGHAVVVHAGEDDLTSQPAGNSGARVACGVIGVSQP